MTPWLAKNVIDTGNPVYPLAYRVFGGRHWDAALRRQVVDAPTARGPSRGPRWSRRLVDVAGRSDWQSPLYVALAPLALLRRGSRRLAVALWGYVGLPLPDLVAADPPPRPLLAAALAPAGRPGGPGGRLDREAGPGRSCSGRSWSVAIATNLAFVSTALAGPQRVDGRPRRPPRPRSPRCSTRRWPGSTPSCPRTPRSCSSARRRSSISDHPIVYNTVFNHETIETLARGRTPGQVRRGPPPAGHDPRLRRLVRDRALSLAGQLRVHAVRDARACSPDWSAAGVLEPPDRGSARGRSSTGSARNRPAGSARGPSRGRHRQGCRGMDALTIVTGGAGFIGSHLVEQLVALGRAGPGGRAAGGGRGAPAAGGRGRPGRHPRPRRRSREAVRGGRWVYHLAANPNLWVRDRAEFDAVNHRGTVHVLDAALEAGAERVLHTSTESILTCARRTGPIAEDVEIALSDAVGPYCRSKLLAENEALARARAGAAGRRRQPDDAGRAGRPGALAADPADPRLLPGQAPRADGLHAQPDRRPRRGRGPDPDDGAGPARPPLPARRREPDARSACSAILSELTGVPVPRWRVPYALGLAVAVASEFWADHVTGRTPKATVTGVRLTRRTMHFDPSRSLDRARPAAPTRPPVAGRRRRLAPPGRADRGPTVRKGPRGRASSWRVATRRMKRRILSGPHAVPEISS